MKTCRSRDCPNGPDPQPNESFHVDRSRPDGLGNYCKACMIQRHLKYNSARRQEKAEYSRSYYAENREAVSIRSKALRKSNPERQKAKYQKNIQYHKAHYQENKEKILQCSRDHRKSLARYETFAPQVETFEEVQRDPDNETLLQVKCAYCGRWFNPTVTEIQMRIGPAVGRHQHGENRLYCSNDCKQSCPIFHKVKYPEGYAPATSREVQAELRQLVFLRDSYTCQKCGSTCIIHCHHIKAVINDPLESADIDNCITLCSQCHLLVHSLPGCGYAELRCTGTNSKE